MLDDLTDHESALTDAACGGTELVCADRVPIRAALIRELLLGRRGELDPRGVRLRGARVVGALELDYVTAKVGLDLVDCDIEEPVDLTQAALPRLVLVRSRLAGLRAAGVRISGDLLLDEATIVGTEKTGAVRLLSAHVGRALSLDGVEVRNDFGSALHADRMQVDGIVLLRDARLSGEGRKGAVRMVGAHLKGELNMSRTDIRNDTGPALDAATLTVDSTMFLDQVTVSGHGDMGAIRVVGARIGGRISLDGADIRNTSGPALGAEGAHVGGDLLVHGARFSGAGSPGALQLANARVGGDLYLVDTEVRNDSGAAVHADGLRVDGTPVLLRTRMSGSAEDGTIWLLGAHVAGLRVVESEVDNDAGPALFAAQLRVQGNVFLQLTRMSGAGRHAAIRLGDSRIGGQLVFGNMTISNPDGQLLDLREAQVGASVWFPTDVVCPDPAACDGRLVNLNDFSYGSIEGADWRQWLHLVRHHTKEYRPSPYQQLAAVERAAGHDGNARNILIAQQQDLRHRSPAALGGWLTRRFHWLWGALAGYGYRARRTALALLVALAAAGGVTLWAGHVMTGPGRHAAEHTITSSAPRTPCSTIELIGLGLDRGLPLGPTGLRSRCDLDTESVAGQVFTVLLWIVQAAVWGLATLALAGYTGLIRKSA
ncbi:hypothetical protein [Actinophytocola sp.]|uniref:hypothetical protein n=1 Tax=Actinophytocola sp. TaxID=1872138 RepID=UPI002ED377B4